MKCALICSYASLLSIGGPLATAASAPAPRERTLPATLSVKVDPLFSDYADPTGPAIVAIVVRNGEIVYRHVSGMADIERRVPATMNSMFEIGSTAKMFTAFLVEKLIQSGELSGTDDIRKYVPELPDYGTPILISELLHHTSGVRDYFELMAMRGIRLDDSMSQEDAMRLTCRQRALNFKPGTEAAYSNSNFVLLAQIVKKVTGKSLADYAVEGVFKPASMQKAIFEVSRNTLMPDRALSYVRIGPGRDIALPLNYEVIGPSGLWLSGNDLAAWLRYLDLPDGSTKRVLAAMEVPGRLSDGEEVKWGAGLLRKTHAGLLEFYHDGGNEGYRAIVAYFPERRLEIGIMTNAPSADPEELVEQIADRVLQLPAVPIVAPAPPTQTPPAKTAFSAADLVGTYYSDELDTSYRLSLSDGKLVATHIRNPAVELKAAGPDKWTGEVWWFKTLEVVRDSEDKPIGFRLSGFRGARAVEFRRQSN
jgi:CubicO group peptidase (beta-lactamase class C family)